MTGLMVPNRGPIHGQLTVRVDNQVHCVVPNQVVRTAYNGLAKAMCQQDRQTLVSLDSFACKWGFGNTAPTWLDTDVESPYFSPLKAPAIIQAIDSGDTLFLQIELAEAELESQWIREIGLTMKVADPVLGDEWFFFARALLNPAHQKAADPPGETLVFDWEFAWNVI